jgi:hypothetical protein
MVNRIFQLVATQVLWAIRMRPTPWDRCTLAICWIRPKAVRRRRARLCVALLVLTTRLIMQHTEGTEFSRILSVLFYPAFVCLFFYNYLSFLFTCPFLDLDFAITFEFYCTRCTHQFFNIYFIRSTNVSVFFFTLLNYWITFVFFYLSNQSIYSWNV